MQPAEKVSITMPPEMMRLIRDSIEAGEYASTSEVLRDAMRAWLRQREEHQERLESIRARVRQSLDDPRPSVPMEEAEENLERYMRLRG